MTTITSSRSTPSNCYLHVLILTRLYFSLFLLMHYFFFKLEIHFHTYIWCKFVCIISYGTSIPLNLVPQDIMLLLSQFYHKCDHSNRPIICSPNSNFAAAPIPCLLTSTTILTLIFGSFFHNIPFKVLHTWKHCTVMCAVLLYINYTLLLFSSQVFLYSKAHSPANTPITKKKKTEKEQKRMEVKCVGLLWYLCMCVHV